MGESQLDQVESDELFYIPLEGFKTLREAGLEPVPLAETFAAYVRVNVLYSIARAWSGHPGTCFSSVDIMTWLFLTRIQGLAADSPDGSDIFLSSKGHDAPALYTILTGLGLLDFEQLHHLRRLGGLAGHPHVETPYIQANTGSLGMGISKAKGMALANRLHNAPKRIYVLTGDGELQEGQIWESLASAAELGLDEITVIVDHNKIQSDTWVEDVSPLGDLEAKFRSFGWQVERCDGHDFVALDTALASLETATGRPRILVADTVKGKGVSFMEGPVALAENPLYLFHSGAPNEEAYAKASAELLGAARATSRRAGLNTPPIDTGRRPPRKPALVVDRLVDAYSRALVTEAEHHPELVVLDADLVKDCGLLEFRERFPGRFIECGIAEQDMVSQAGGLARRGAIPVAHSFACFLSTRPNEQIYNNASEATKVIYVGSLAGLLPGGPGHSHQSVRDISALSAIPNLVLIEPCAEIEVAAALTFCLDGTDESSYLRLVSLGWPLPFQLPSDHSLQLGIGTVVRPGHEVVLIGAGPWLLANAFHAAETLQRDHNVAVKVIDLPWLNRLDGDWLVDTIRGARHVVTLDNHYVDGGQGQMIASCVAEHAVSIPVTRIGVTELPVCGTNEEVLAHHALDVPGLVASITAALARVGKSSANA
ncbi:MAG: transketolase C-terminal domain-containing protein [Acidobacteriota bacterium]|nr:transketolase C-terminal domain-containing protein [Acidobacteriota bacterium]